MSGALRNAGSKLCSNVLRASGSASEATSCFPGQQFRFIGGDKIGEFWGRPSSYTEGTAFLGTPKEHLEMIKKRPLSPDVIGIDNKSLHYKLPWGAISSIANRGTGTVLSFGFAGAAYIALFHDLAGVIETVAAVNPLLLFPLKFFLSYNIVYHWAGGMRHLAWDMVKIGNQAEKGSLLEVPAVELSSKVLLAGSAVVAVVLALL